VASLGTGRSLVARLGGWNAALVGVACYVAAMVIVMLVLRPIDEVPAGFSAELLWKFRLASLGAEAVLWATLGLTFGVLAERPLASRARRMAMPRAGG
jgi:predicted cobalt transporter CbtA